MVYVSFAYHDDVAEAEQDGVGGEIRKARGVNAVHRMKPDAIKPALRRIWYADVEDLDAASALVADLSGRPEVKSAAIPATVPLKPRPDPI